MNILELDFGNSGLKWRVVTAGECPVVKRIYYSAPEFSALRFAVFERVRVASVLSDERTHAYLQALGIENAEHARSDAPVAGFTNNYHQPEKLGVDRWLAALAARRDAAGRACLVIDLGTAITVDYISATGVFEGGYIIAGKQLLQNALIKDTAKVRFDSDAAEHCWPAWPAATAEAVQWGAVFVLNAVVERAIKQAQAWQGNDNFAVYLTGGDGAVIAADLQNAVQYRENLVLDGLAVALP